MHKGLLPRPLGCGSSPLCILAGSLLFTAINRIKITFDYDKCTLCHIIIIGVIFTGMCGSPWGYQSWLKVTFFPLCAQKVSVQAPSAKTRFAPPSALKGTCVQARKVLVQAPSAKTRFAPPSALKGTCVQARKVSVNAPSGKTRFPPPSALKGTCAYRQSVALPP